MLPNLGGFRGRVRLLTFEAVPEPRGTLHEFSYSALPFKPVRSFIISNVPGGTVRGGHAHRENQQLVVCLQGRVDVDVVLDEQRASIALKDPAVGLFIDSGVWAQQKYGENAILLVFASTHFSSGSYISSSSPSEATV